MADYLSKVPEVSGNIGSTGLFDSITGTMKDLGITGADIMNIGLGLANYFQEGDKLKLYETALNDHLKTSQMNRDLAYDQLAQQVGVQKSLGGAFGADTGGYDTRMSQFVKYKPTETATV